MLKRTTVGWRVRHVSGKRRIRYNEREFIVCVLVRNGRRYLSSFLRHYRDRGARHFVFLDNNSNDGFASAAAHEPDVTVLTTALSYKKYKFALKQYLVRRFASGRWVLAVDMDELFDFPYSDEIAMGDLLGYLDAQRYTAVTAQLLDMFSHSPLGYANHEWPPDLISDFPYYDVSTVEDFAVDADTNRVSNPNIRCMVGGIRAKVFDVEPMLTKYPLLKMDARIRPVPDSAHTIERARIADFSTVLLHYKFLDDFAASTQRIVQEASYYNHSAEYRTYQKVLAETARIRLYGEHSQRLNCVGQLVDDDFLQTGPEFLHFVKKARRAS